MTRVAYALLVLSFAYTTAAIIELVNPGTVWIGAAIALIAGALPRRDASNPRQDLGPAFRLQTVRHRKSERLDDRTERERVRHSRGF